MREACSGPSSAACPASAKSATHSFSRGRKSGRHKNRPESCQFSAQTPRLVSSTSRAPRYTSQHTSNASSGFTLIVPPCTVSRSQQFVRRIRLTLRFVHFFPFATHLAIRIRVIHVIHFVRTPRGAIRIFVITSAGTASPHRFAGIHLSSARISTIFHKHLQVGYS